MKFALFCRVFMSSRKKKTDRRLTWFWQTLSWARRDAKYPCYIKVTVSGRCYLEIIM